MRWMNRLALAAAALGGGVGAAAQDVAYLLPDAYAAAPGAKVAVHVERAAGAEPVRVAWPEDRAGWMFISADGDQENRHGVKADAPGGDSVSVMAPNGGAEVVGLDLAAAVSSVDAGRFADFRAKFVAAPRANEPAAGSVAPTAAREAKVRVRRYESLNTIVRVNAEGLEPGPSQIVTAKTGQKASIRPVMDPTGLRAGSDVPFRVYTDGRAVGGGILTAVNAATGRTQTVTGDSAGICQVHIDSTGLWRLQFHHAVTSPDSEADWNLYSATLTFEVTRAAKEAE